MKQQKNAIIGQIRARDLSLYFAASIYDLRKPGHNNQFNTKKMFIILEVINRL